MPTRNINLTERLDRFIELEVGSGRYGNASEVVREGLRLLERTRQQERARLNWLRGAVKEGLDELARGEGVEISSEEQLEREMNQIAAEAAAQAAGRRKRG